MSYAIVIPARYASTRLPGKPLLPIGSKTMLEWVYERACASGASEVVIATDDARISEAAKDFGADVVMTSVDHASGTDRIAEVARRRGWSDEQIVVNLQGDEPLMPPALLAQVADDLAINGEAVIATLCTPILDEADFIDPNCVKVVFDCLGNALYFSRAAIPFDRDARGGGVGHRHLGVYAYRAGFLREFAATPPCYLEELEKLEQLRAMWLGKRIRVSVASELPGPGVDTLPDLEKVRQLLGSPA